MSHPLLAFVGRSAVARAAIAAALIVGLVGLVTVLPAQCFGGACSAPAEAELLVPEPASVPAQDQLSSAERLAADELPVVAEVPVAASGLTGPSLTRNDLIALTFDVLDAEPQSPPANVTTGTVPVTRMVRTTVIRVDPTPLPTAVQPETAPADPASALPSDPTAIAEADKPAAKPAVVATEAAPEATDDAAYVSAYADEGRKASGNGKVLGAGVNVRSGPSSGSDKLFALAGGAAVTVMENQKGWLRVVDATGRSGWAYKDYISQ